MDMRMRLMRATVCGIPRKIACGMLKWLARLTISVASRSGVIAMTYSFWAGDTSRRKSAAAIAMFASLFIEFIESK
ncbi:MAG: hypothetical protein BWY82_01191 [Verrucomicrobia bacterium ADurb.Bin474]|nr:MAG: hypothetical protein BWY82_01191 [Verrucomicrobia bacterium ADurb.Bin474]